MTPLSPGDRNGAVFGRRWDQDARESRNPFRAAGLPVTSTESGSWRVMMSDQDRLRRKREEIDSNLAFFLAELPKIPQSQKGKFALIRNQEIVGFYDTAVDALSAGNTAFQDGIFSIQQVTDSAVNLGYYSHAVPLASAQ